MDNNKQIEKMRNVFLALLLLIAALFAAYYEGYFQKITTIFRITLAASSIIVIWLSLYISTKRFLSFIAVIFIIEYIKEAIGIKSNIWVYHGFGGQFVFGVWCWVLAGLVSYGLASRVLIRLIRKLKFTLPRWLNLIIFLLIAALIPFMMGDYLQGTGALFWLLYALLLIFGIYSVLKMDFPVFAGLVLSAWIIGIPSEYVGSISSGVWEFTMDANFPPLFLLLGCWPIEIIAQYSMSAFLVNEPLDKDTY